MKIKSIELQNYKSHKHFLAEFNGENKLIQGNKGSGKTSIMDAVYWILTGGMVDDPTPVDENGVIINHLTISASLETMDGHRLKVESKQKWNKKGVIQANHEMTYYINDTPCIKKDYLAHLEEQYGTLEQRKILLDPTWFAHGNGLAITGKTPKTATQRRKEIVIAAAGVSDIEQSIHDNDNRSKQAKHALSTLKKKQDEVSAGVDSLESAKIDVSHLDYQALIDGIAKLELEKSSSIASLETLNSGNDTHNALQRTLSDAETNLSTQRSLYAQKFNDLLRLARTPYDEYQSNKQTLESKLQQAIFGQNQQDQARNNLLSEIEQLNKAHELKANQYQILSQEVYNPTSTTCQTCSQPLPVEQMVSAEARFNKNKSDNLANLIAEDNALVEKINAKVAEANLPQRDFGIETIRQDIINLGSEPTVETIPTFEETPEYQPLVDAINSARLGVEQQSDDGTKAIYQTAINNIQASINEQQLLLGSFETNAHLDKQIEMKSIELNGIATEMNKQEEILDECKKFIRETLEKLQDTIESVFDGIRFKMFEYTLDGSQVDTCIVYAKTSVGYIPWESLSGGQKRSATIKLSNAFSKAWGFELPLFIDDTQLYQEDELDSKVQLIRITEVPHAILEVK